MANVGCSIDGCRSEVGPKGARGWCPRHYQRWLRTGQPCRRCETCSTPVRGSRRFCSDQCKPRCAVEGCDGPARKRGWCAAHYSQHTRTGDEPEPFRWKWGGEVSYSGVHERLRTERGPASTYECVDCGGPARDWSYDHSAADERRSTEGPYTTDLAHYEPRCCSCHKRFDMEVAA